jgi:hypothetical protein
LSKEPTISEITKVVEEKEKRPKKCSKETLEKFYLCIKRSILSPIGVSKREIEKIMGYETPITVSGVDSINNQIANETGYRPFTIDKSHIFINSDVLRVDKDIAELVLDELRSKCSEEPKMPILEENYESTVKQVIRKDYSILSMFAKSNTLLYKNGDVVRFRESIVSKNVTLSIEKVADIFKENLKKRYAIDLDFICKSKRYITIVDDERNSNIKQALITIENIFASMFCEDIVSRERTVWEQQILEESSPSEQEENILNMIEKCVFSDGEKELFLSEIWNKLDSLNVSRGWKILDVVKKCPEKFKIGNKRNKSGIREDFIKYIASPTPLQVQKVISEEKVDENNNIDEVALIPESEEKNFEDIVKIPVEFINKEDIESIYGKRIDTVLLEIQTLSMNKLFMEITVQMNDKKSIMDFLKLYYASKVKSEEIIIIYPKIALMCLVKDLETALT